jgi:hypothetical protein
MWEGDVGDGGVQRLHDGCQHHRQGDEGATGSLVCLPCGCARHINLDRQARQGALMAGVYLGGGTQTALRVG